MLKRLSKFLLLTLITFVISSYSLICMADEDTTLQATEDITLQQTEDTTITEDVYSGDLYLFDNNVVMDKFVDGNVFIFGNNVEITGQVNGNLFVFADNLTFSNTSIVRYSIFACADTIYYDGGTYEGDLYVAAKNLEMTYNSYVARDAKIVASNVVLKSAVGRDVDLLCSSLDLGEGTDIPIIYGNLRYKSNNEITIPEGVFEENKSATYTKLSNTLSITDTLINFGICIVTAISVYIILKKLNPTFVENIDSKNFSFSKLIKYLGIGLGTIITVIIFFVLLLGTGVGIKLAFILGLLFIVLCLISEPTLSIAIANSLKPALKIEKNYMYYLVLSLISVILYGITFIPYVGEVLGFVISIISIGLLTSKIFPHKELSDEEKAIIKENKEKRKQEKLEAKAAKKEEKLRKHEDKHL